MKSKLLKQQKGFTIIEVLIVLAIAGLIILIVFLAVPALQRNSRNTQRKNDVSALVGAIQEYENNNNGKTPTVDTNYEGNFTPGYYTTANMNFSANPATYSGAVVPISTTPSATNINTDSLTVVTGYKCDPTDATANPTRDTTRSIAVVYVVESNGGNGQRQCQGL
jgi:prepilin-type N-terminal cleavage/methylation domain-containing protein